MTLGADGRDVMGLVLRQALRPVAIGALIGVIACAAVSQVLSDVLYGIGSHDQFLDTSGARSDIYLYSPQCYEKETEMKMRIDYHAKFSEGPLQAMLALEKYVHKCGLEPKLLELVKMRASQINGCAYCLDMHSKDARMLGETEQRLYALSAWRETTCYSERERAALEWTEAVTLVSQTHVPDEV